MDDKDSCVFVFQLGEQAVVLGAQAWAKREDYFYTLWDVQEKIKLAFDEEGIVIPFNQITVQMINR